MKNKVRSTDKKISAFQLSQKSWMDKIQEKSSNIFISFEGTMTIVQSNYPNIFYSFSIT